MQIKENLNETNSLRCPHQLNSVVVTSPKLTLMAMLIGEVHSNFGSRNSVCRLLRIFIAQNINIVYLKYNTGGLSTMGLVRYFPC